MLADGLFTDHGAPPEPLLGMEVELNLVDDEMNPAMVNAKVLDAIADPDYQTELGQFNIEINVSPRLFVDNDTCLSNNGCAALLRATGHLRRYAPRHDRHAAHPADRALRIHWVSANPRYDMLNQQIFAARGEDIEIDIAGVPLGEHHVSERLHTSTDSILPQASCTSLRLHLRVAPEDFAAHWNAAQAIAGVQVALAGNAPFLAGTALCHESLIPVFEQRPTPDHWN